MSTAQFEPDTEVPAITLESAQITIARQAEEINRLRQLVEETGYEDAKLFIQETHFLAVQAVGPILENQVNEERIVELAGIVEELSNRLSEVIAFVQVKELGEELAAFLVEVKATKEKAEEEG